MDMPEEVWEKIFNFLETKDLAISSMVCQRWRSLVNSQRLWWKRCLAKRWDPKLDFCPFDSEDMFQTELEDLCHWRQVYDKNQILYNRWKLKKWTQYSLADDHIGGVFSMNCDENVLSVGYRYGAVAIWNLSKHPEKEKVVTSMLIGFPVVTVKTTEKYLVVVQKKLLQVFDRISNDLKLLISFDLGEDNLEISEKRKLLADLFTDWYKECLRYKEVYSCNKLIFAIEEDTVMVAKAGDTCVYVWDAHTLRLTDKVELTTGVKDLIGWEGRIYLAAVENGVSRVSVYRLSGKVEEVITSPGTSKLLVSQRYIVGIPGDGAFTLRRLRVWCCTSYRWVGSRTVCGPDPQAVVTPCHLVVYSEDSLITVWDPAADTVISVFSVGYPVGFMKTSFSDFLVVFANCGLHLYNWAQGFYLYTIYSQLDWKGDHRRLICLTPKMIIAAGPNNHPQILSLL